MITALIAAGADPYWKDFGGITPILAVLINYANINSSQQIKIIKILIEAGADNLEDYKDFADGEILKFLETVTTEAAQPKM